MDGSTEGRQEAAGAHKRPGTAAGSRRAWPAYTPGLTVCVLFWFLGFFAPPLPAHGADVFCGVDTDFSNATSHTSSNPCPEPDKDHDGWASTEQVGVLGQGKDCDDTDSWVHPGGLEDTEGCSAGEYRTCAASGTFSACAAITSFTCHTGGGHTYWVDDGETDCAGAGTTYGDPEHWRCWFDTTMTGYHAPAAGDCIVFQAGSYSGTWSDSGTTRQIYLNNKDGTATNPIIIRAEPGAFPGYSGKVLFNGAGTSPTQVFPVHFLNSNYVKLVGFEIDGNGDYSNSVHIEGGAGVNAKLNYVHRIDGESDDNVACIKCRVDTEDCSIHNNILEDCREVGAESNQNNGCITIMDDTGTPEANYNVCLNSSTVGHGIWIKHAGDTATDPEIIGNFIDNVSRSAIGTENRDTIIKGNWISDCNGMAIEYGNIGSDHPWFEGAIVSYNTVQRCGFLDVLARWFNGDDTPNTTHRTCGGANTCVLLGGTPNIAGCCYPSGTGDSSSAISGPIFTADHNIMEDDNASYGGDGGDGVTRFCPYHCDNGEFAAAAGKAIWTNNVYFSSGTSDLHFSYFGQSNVAGTTDDKEFGSLTDWKAAGFDVGSVQDDPALDADGVSAEYVNHGWNADGANLFTDPTPTPTPTPNPRNPAVLDSNRRHRR